MLTGLKEALSMLWTRIRRLEGWVYGISQSPVIIEEGNSYQSPITWRYRKWSNGTAECWGRITSQSYAMTTQSGNGYYPNATLSSHGITL